MPTKHNITTKPDIHKLALNGENQAEKITMTAIEASTAATDPTSTAVTDTERRILVADDDADIRILLKTFLEDEGYTVSEAANGQDALEGVRSGAYDLVLLDMRLPGMTGMDVLKQLREKQGNVPVILITAYGSPNIAIQASSLGAYSYHHQAVRA